ncbi:hypothetical protein H1385_001398 [Salmonella enterica]|nr:hypothetical protein [Salmonella enterica]EFR3523429.1 hypothetical protein [Salmonella enterica]EGG4981329.1 hypothetical protein [Salmonella enterica]EGS0218146.1 hypothetical protein [Salmonella enterica subsp. enterica serovar Barranquilla]EHC9889575.1 hypothetical protein [Salmonella enterica subsp. enterica serovar Barranquilla]
MFPAPAGINRGNQGPQPDAVSVPRASGDKPELAGVDVTLVYVFPAPAGINRGNQGPQPDAVSVPRASGDKPEAEIASGNADMCSPRQRG